MNKIHLRKFVDSDIDILAKWLCKPYIKKWYDPIDEWITEIKNRHNEFAWLHHFIVMCDEKAIGFCQYYDCFDSKEYEDWNGRFFDTPGEIYTIDYLIGDENYIGKGFGKELINILSEMVFSVGAKEIIVDPDKKNAASNGVLKASGYIYSEKYEYYRKLTKNKHEGEHMKISDFGTGLSFYQSVKQTSILKSTMSSGKNVDWSKIPTKDYTSPPPSDIRSMVRQNARQYANATNDEERARLKKEADALFHKYVSHAAPDRKKLLAGAKTAINSLGGASNFKPKFTRSKNAIDYFIEAQQKNSTQKCLKEISFEGGSVVTDGSGRYNVKVGGEDAISITGSDYTFFISQAEITSQQEIVSFWNQNCGAAMAENEARGYNNSDGLDVKV
jgi:RimJ/RimL family protein N-acetyltransferase